MDVVHLKTAVDMFLIRSGSRELPVWEVLIRPDERGNVWLEGYSKPPVDPWGNEYEILSGERAVRDYEIRSRGPDGMPDTADDITSHTIKDSRR